MLLLHVKGRRTGRERTVPLVYLPDGDRYVIIASKGGAPKDPHWYHNLMAAQDTQIEVGTQTIPVKAVEITGPEREALYARQAEIMPAFTGYQERAGRTIPVIALEPVR
jgi:deazaflavin-dependent oxidoreductase (nitroreductase family)